MKKSIAFLIMALAISPLVSSQNNGVLSAHFENYYQQMKAQGDVQGIIRL